MFADACTRIREAIYGLNGLSQVGPNQVNATNATGFMIAPGVIVTAAHFCHVENDPTKPVHQLFEVIRSPDIGQTMERAALLAEDSVRDVALLRVPAPRSNTCVTLTPNRVPTGTPCGALGFPLASVVFSQNARSFNCLERFQSASISAFATMTDPTGRVLGHYETDSLMYGGSSGCPGFLTDTQVFGMHTASITDRTAQAGAPPSSQKAGIRLAISIWVPAADILDFARASGVAA
jgi:hypothetical protein